LLLKNETELGVVVHACNPSTWEAETGESKAWDQPGLQSKFVANLGKIVRPCLKKSTLPLKKRKEMSMFLKMRHTGHRGTLFW
jgi:hypothetical protein